jgi:hypothetical protein
MKVKRKMPAQTINDKKKCSIYKDEFKQRMLLKQQQKNIKK